MKKTAIMQPYFFPYISYWQLINAVDTFVILDDVNFIMRGWINRNNILINDKPHLFSIPLDKPSQNKFICGTKLKFTGSEKSNFLKMIQLAYKKAPYFDDFYPIFSKIVLTEDDDLTNFIHNSLVKVCKYLGLKTEFLRSSNIQKDNSLKSEDKIIEICKKLDTDTYINLAGGKELYNHNHFEEKNIKLRFIDTDFNNIRYKQFKNEFIQGLSFLDIIMFNSTDEIKNLLNQYTLINGSE